MQSPNDIIESPPVEDFAVKKQTSQVQKDHLARARSIKAALKERKLVQGEIYANELKVVNNHLERFSSQLNSLASVFNSLKQPTAIEPSGGIKRKAEEDIEEEQPKKKTSPVADEQTAQWISFFSQAVGATAAVATLYLFKRLYKTDPDHEHVKRYENFTG